MESDLSQDCSIAPNFIRKNITRIFEYDRIIKSKDIHDLISNYLHLNQNNCFIRNRQII